MDESNSRLAKNTLFLYVRFFVTMLVSLYTSRVVLQSLGVVNFGLYNVISGVITIFAMLNLSLSSQRFISYELGLKNIEKVKETIKNFNLLNLSICIIIFIFAETAGLWFLYYKMNIPVDRIFASIVAYQCTIVSFMSLIYVSTYVSCVISYEKISAFALISVVEVVGKLAIALILPLLSSLDSLIVYSVLMMVIQISINVSYLLYCHIKLDNIPLGISYNKSVIKEISGFAFLLNFTGIFVWLSQQGLNILLNVFCGPVVNAARGISMQVMGAVENFSYSFLKAVAPQLTKAYANHEYKRLMRLFIYTSKYAFLLVFFISSPIIFNSRYILELWLGSDIPNHTDVFVQLTLVWITFSILSQPCMYIVQASGSIKLYQMVDMLGCGAIFIFSYILLFFQCECWSVYVASISVELIMLLIRLKIVFIKSGIFAREYYIDVVLKNTLIVCAVGISLYYINNLIDDHLIGIIFSYIIEFIIIVFFISITANSIEKTFINKLFRYEKK